jgi:serine/threonine-protein kinase
MEPTLTPAHLEAHADTVASRGPVSAENAIPTERSNTVLPKVEWQGDMPKLVNPQRERFEELGLLGAGGMGEVVLAKDHDIDRTVALKRLPLGVDMGAVLRFANEVRTVGSLEHPNIVPVHDVGVDANGRLYFVMKRVEGETLEAVIGRLRDGDKATLAKYSYPKRVQVFLGILSAIGYAHKQGFVHRDIKPANVMLGHFGEVTVVDWGLAKRIHGKDGAPLSIEKELPVAQNAPLASTLKTQLGTVMGTPLYMSPEQARGEHDKVDERSDIYSLTALLYELLFTEHYLKGLNTLADVLEGVKTREPLLPERVPPELRWVIKRGLAKDASQRFQSIDEVITHVQRVLDGNFEIQCPQTMTKKMMLWAAHQMDKSPHLTMGATYGGAALSLFAIGRLIFSLL